MSLIKRDQNSQQQAELNKTLQKFVKLSCDFYFAEIYTLQNADQR
jgi:hypothetical protein